MRLRRQFTTEARRLIVAGVVLFLLLLSAIVGAATILQQRRAQADAEARACVVLAMTLQPAADPVLVGTTPVRPSRPRPYWALECAGQPLMVRADAGQP